MPWPSSSPDAWRSCTVPDSAASGRSYVDGLRRALQSDATLICQMDGDWSHDPQYLPAMIAACGTNDVVIGSRYLRASRW
jgi:dolichol-phosphate mannosyltransferase